MCHSNHMPCRFTHMINDFEQGEVVRASKDTFGMTEGRSIPIKKGDLLVFIETVEQNDFLMIRVLADGGVCLVESFEIQKR